MSPAAWSWQVYPGKPQKTVKDLGPCHSSQSEQHRWSSWPQLWPSPALTIATMGAVNQQTEERTYSHSFTLYFKKIKLSLGGKKKEEEWQDVGNHDIILTILQTSKNSTTKCYSYINVSKSLPLKLICVKSKDLHVKCTPVWLKKKIVIHKIQCVDLCWCQSSCA